MAEERGGRNRGGTREEMREGERDTYVHTSGVSDFQGRFCF